MDIEEQRALEEDATWYMKDASASIGAGNSRDYTDACELARSCLYKLGKGRFGKDWEPTRISEDDPRYLAMVHEGQTPKTFSPQERISAVIHYLTPGSSIYSERLGEARDNERIMLAAELEEKAQTMLGPTSDAPELKRLEKALIRHSEAGRPSKVDRLADIIVETAKLRMESLTEPELADLQTTTNSQRSPRDILQGWVDAYNPKGKGYLLRREIAGQNRWKQGKPPEE